MWEDELQASARAIEHRQFSLYELAGPSARQVEYHDFDVGTQDRYVVAAEHFMRLVAEFYGSHRPPDRTPDWFTLMRDFVEPEWARADDAAAQAGLSTDASLNLRAPSATDQSTPITPADAPADDDPVAAGWEDRRRERGGGVPKCDPTMRDLADEAGIGDDTFRRVREAAGIKVKATGAKSRHRRYSPAEVDRLILAALAGTFLERRAMAEKWAKWGSAPQEGRN